MSPAIAGASYVFLRDVRQRRGLVGRLPAERRRAGQLRGGVLRGSRRNRAPRRYDHDHARGRGLAGGRRRGPSCVDLQSRQPRTREIELTSYAEIVLAPPADDAAHPAFSKLFVQTEFVPRARRAAGDAPARASPDEPEVWAAHLAVVEGETVGETAVRNRPGALPGTRARHPHADLRHATAGRFPTRRAPCSIRSSACAAACGFRPARPCASRSGPCGRDSREEVLDLADKHHDAAAFERAITLAWTQAQVQLHHLGIGADEAHLFQRLANHVLYSDPTLRPPAEILKRGALGPSTLWAHGISGDLPIVLVRIDEADDLELVRQLLRAHEYLAAEAARRRSGDPERTRHRPMRRICRIAGGAGAHQPVACPERTRRRRGNVFVLRADLVSAEVRRLLQTAARVVLARPSRQPRRAGQAPCEEHHAPRHSAAARRPTRALAPPNPTCRRRRSSSSTASADSARTDANT